MALYAGLSPQDALQLWYQNRQKYGADGKGATTPEQRADYEGNMTTLAQENPQAWQLLKTGQNDNGKTRQVFNPQTGNWDSQDVKGFFSHPESWLQLGFGGALGGLGAAAAMAGAAPTAGIPATAAGEFGPMAGGYAGATTSAAIPASLDATGLAGGAAGGFGPLADAYGGATNTWQGGVPNSLDPTAAANAGAGMLGSLNNPSALLKALAGLGGLFGGKLLTGNMAQNNVPPQLNQLLDLSVQRAQSQQPLFNAATNGLYQMLPDFAKKG